MINFTAGLIKTPTCYINPNNVVNFCENEGATFVSYTDSKVGELEDVSEEKFAKAFISASNNNGIFNVMA